MSILSVPFTEKQYKKLLKALAELIDEVGNNEKYPLAQLIETIGNLIEKYENDQFAITQYVMWTPLGLNRKLNMQAEYFTVITVK